MAMDEYVSAQAQKAHDLGTQLAKDLFDPSTPLGRQVQLEMHQQQVEWRLAEAAYLRKVYAKTNTEWREFMFSAALVCSLVAYFFSEDKVGAAIFAGAVAFVIWMIVRVALAILRAADSTR